MTKTKPEMSWDIDEVTMEQVETEIGRTIHRLHKLQVLYSALQEEDHARVRKLIQQYKTAQEATP
jgi:hypothetical protein